MSKLKLNAGGLSSLVIARDKEQTILKQYIEFSQHTVITAPRRYGKTTLVNKVLEDLKDDYLIVKVDIFEATNIKELCELYINAVYKSIGIANFLHSIKESIFTLLDNFKLQYQQDGIKLGYEISKEQDENKLLEKTFNFANKFATLFGKTMIVFFDEFGDTLKFGEEFLKKLRAYMQTHNSIVYLFAGSQASVMNNIFLNNNSAFFNFASLFNLGLLDTLQTKEFLDNFSINNKTFDKQSIDKLEITTKFHPFYLIKTLQEAYILALLDNKDIIDEQYIIKAIKKILDDNNAYFESLWQKINNKKYKGTIFKTLSHSKDLKLLDINSSYKSQLLKELKDEGLLTKDLKFTDPFISLWLNNWKIIDEI